MKFIRPLLGCALRFPLAPASSVTLSASPMSGSGGGLGTAGTIGGLGGGDLGFPADGSIGSSCVRRSPRVISR